MHTIPEKSLPANGKQSEDVETNKPGENTIDEPGEIFSDGSASAFSATERALSSDMDNLHQALKKRDPDNPSGLSNY